MTMEEEVLQRGMAKGKAEGIAAGRQEGIEQGVRQARLEDARKMLDRGCDWGFVTDVTGIRQEDLAS